MAGESSKVQIHSLIEKKMIKEFEAHPTRVRCITTLTETVGIFLSPATFRFTSLLLIFWITKNWLLEVCRLFCMCVHFTISSSSYDNGITTTKVMKAHKYIFQNWCGTCCYYNFLAHIKAPKFATI